MKKGKLIAIESPVEDLANNQAALLKSFIDEKNKTDCVIFNFPRYLTPTGMLADELLRSISTNLSLVEQVKILTNDHLAARDEITSLLDKGIDVICVRYVLNVMTYFSQLEEIETPSLLKYIEEHIKDVSYVQNMMPKPDLVIVMSEPITKKDKLKYLISQKDRESRALNYGETIDDFVLRCKIKYNTYKDVINYKDSNNYIPDGEIHATIVERYLNLNKQTPDTKDK